MERAYSLPETATLVTEGWLADFSRLLGDDGRDCPVLSLCRYFEESRRLFLDRFDELMTAEAEPTKGELAELKAMFDVLIEVKMRLAGGEH